MATLRVPEKASGSVPQYARQLVYNTTAGSGASARISGAPGAIAAQGALGAVQTVRDLGQAGVEAAKTGMGLYAEYSRTKATEAYNKFQESMNTDLYGEGGVFSRKGENARNAVADTEELVRTRAEECSTELGVLGRNLFARQVEAYNSELLPRVQQHAAQEFDNWRVQTQQTRLDQSRKHALEHYEDSVAFSQNLKESNLALMEIGRINGLSREETERAVRENTSSAHLDRANAFLSQNRVEEAKTILKEGLLEEKDRQTLENAIRNKEATLLLASKEKDPVQRDKLIRLSGQNPGDTASVVKIMEQDNRYMKVQTRAEDMRKIIEIEKEGGSPVECLERLESAGISQEGRKAVQERLARGSTPATEVEQADFMRLLRQAEGAVPGRESEKALLASAMQIGLDGEAAQWVLKVRDGEYPGPQALSRAIGTPVTDVALYLATCSVLFQRGFNAENRPTESDLRSACAQAAGRLAVVYGEQTGNIVRASHEPGLQPEAETQPSGNITMKGQPAENAAGESPYGETPSAVSPSVTDEMGTQAPASTPSSAGNLPAGAPNPGESPATGSTAPLSDSEIFMQAQVNPQVEYPVSLLEKTLDPETAEALSHAFLRGVGNSSTGMFLENLGWSIPGVEEARAFGESEGLVENLVEVGGQLMGDAPTLVMGGVLGKMATGAILSRVGVGVAATGALSTGGAAAGSGALTEGMRAAYMYTMQHGNVKNWDDFVNLVSEVLSEGGKGGAINLATLSFTQLGRMLGTHGIGQLVKKAARDGAGQAGRKAAVSFAETFMPEATEASAELVALLGSMALQSGEIPGIEDFSEAAILILGGRGVGKVFRKIDAKTRELAFTLEGLYIKYGVHPRVVAETILRDPSGHSEKLLAEGRRLAAIRKQRMAEGKPDQSLPLNFTDYRSPEEMRLLNQKLYSVKPEQRDYIKRLSPKAEQSGSSAQRAAENLELHYGVRATPVEIEPGKWALRVDSVPPPPSMESLRSRLDAMYQAMERGETVPKLDLGVVGPEEAARIRACTGIDTLLLKRTLDLRDMEHAKSRHGQEQTKGQTSLTKEDYLHYAETVRRPDWIEKGRDNFSIRYIRRYPDGILYVVERLVKGRLEGRTMWKALPGAQPKVLLSLPAEEEGEEQEKEE